jgi:pyruvate dehydrogenase E1 component alpha subunit/2-oxoisovalerate dehydrogenase E1 component alpha subunit
MAQAQTGGQKRSGQCLAPTVEVWSDEDYARATGLVRVLDDEGRADASKVPALAPEALVRMYEGMLLSRLLDEQLLPLQRQGRIGHYFEARGQEAGAIAGAEAIRKTDYFVQGLREGAAAVYRGMPLGLYVAQILGTSRDVQLGRQMPCHPCLAEIRHVSTSSSVASQIPHAVGIAMAAKICKEDTVSLCYFGDGATSEDDFHAGLNFAGVYKAPAVLVCQNNQWAISTKVTAQTESETLAVKGLAYGVRSLRVDGNDVLAMYGAIKAAVDKARAGDGPTFIEAVTYRLGAHSSADDPTQYRDENEHKTWQGRDPLLRFATWLEGQKLLSAEARAAMKTRLVATIRAAIADEEKAGRPDPSSLFEDVTASLSRSLELQKSVL